MGIIMKKVLAVILSVAVVCFAFAGCSSKDEESTEVITTEAVVETQDAKIKESDAINFIKDSYTAEELGLADIEENYSFMVSGNGIEIDGVKYIRVNANVMTLSDVTADDGGPTYNFRAVGEYFISFDGEKVLMKDRDSGEYIELENRYDEYKSKSEAAQTQAQTEAKAEQDSTEKE